MTERKLVCSQVRSYWKGGLYFFFFFICEEACSSGRESDPGGLTGSGQI